MGQGRSSAQTRTAGHGLFKVKAVCYTSKITRSLHKVSLNFLCALSEGSARCQVAMQRAGSGKVHVAPLRGQSTPAVHGAPPPLSKYELAEGTAGGGAFSPSMGRVALGVTAEAGEDLRSVADRLARWMGRTSFVKNGCCPGGPEHWASNLVWCPAVKVDETQRSVTPGGLPHAVAHFTGGCSHSDWGWAG